MLYTLRSYVGSREEQQDHAKAVTDSKGLLAVVCDGMGGRSFGAQVSSIACEEFCFLYEHSTFGSFVEFASRTADELDRKISRSFNDRGGSTLVAAFVSGGMLEWFAVGDSRLYLFRDGELKALTSDNNYKAELDRKLQNGEISEPEYLSELPRGRALTSFLGVNGIVQCSFSTRKYELFPGDRLLLTSDGLYNALSEQEIAALISSGEDISGSADELITRVQGIDDKPLDNTTFILIEIGE